MINTTNISSSSRSCCCQIGKKKSRFAFGTERVETSEIVKTMKHHRASVVCAHDEEPKSKLLFGGLFDLCNTHLFESEYCR